MKNNLNRYIAAEYENLKSELEQREFVEKMDEWFRYLKRNF